MNHSRTDGIFAIEAEAVREEDRLMDALPLAHRTLGDRETPLHPGN